MKLYDNYIILSTIRTYYTNNSNIDHTQLTEDKYAHIERTAYEYSPKQLLDRVEFWLNNDEIKTVKFNKTPQYQKIEIETYDDIAEIYEYITFKIIGIKTDEMQITKVV